LELLKETPAKIERTIANLEKHARALEKEGDEVATTARKTAKGMLSKFT